MNDLFPISPLLKKNKILFFKLPKLPNLPITHSNTRHLFDSRIPFPKPLLTRPSPSRHSAKAPHSSFSKLHPFLRRDRGAVPSLRRKAPESPRAKDNRESSSQRQVLVFSENFPSIIFQIPTRGSQHTRAPNDIFH